MFSLVVAVRRVTTVPIASELQRRYLLQRSLFQAWKLWIPVNWRIMCRRKAAFCAPCLASLSPLVTEAICSREPVTALSDVVSTLPIGTIVAAGVSVGILGGTFENMLKVLYKQRQVKPSDDEICSYCSGFGNVRCEVCNSRGILFIAGTTVQRTCPACQGKKRERCRRCAGSGKSGMKKKSKSTTPVT